MPSLPSILFFDGRLSRRVRAVWRQLVLCGDLPTSGEAPNAILWGSSSYSAHIIKQYAA
jgi:hypothetical protein